MGIKGTDLVSTYLHQYTQAASLAVFRILFGAIMAISILRFWYHGWIEKLYILPTFRFTYSGFEFVPVLGDNTYVLFIICGLSAALLTIGYKYRVSILLFFLSFTYIELLDKTTYLNHYYFVSVVSFILFWLPAHCTFSIDARHNSALRSELIPSWQVDILKVMLGIVYIYAGLAKLNYDWMYRAMPLAIWLPTKFDIPLLGPLMHEKWMHYIFSWGGAVYDLTIVFFLLWHRTRLFAFAMVVVFHVLTRVLFPIGMFPYIMICSTLIFFSPHFHRNVLLKIASFLKMDGMKYMNGKKYTFTFMDKIGIPILTLFMLFQLLFPLRHLVYTDNVYWTEQGYRFSWRVMLMEKTGYANFKIVNGETGRRFYVQNDDFLTATQQKQMATQPDFILEYGQYLGQHFASQGHEHVEVYVESYVALNGRKNQVYIDPNVDLMSIDYNHLCSSYISPMHE